MVRLVLAVAFVNPILKRFATYVVKACTLPDGPMRGARTAMRAARVAQMAPGLTRGGDAVCANGRADEIHDERHGPYALPAGRKARPRRSVREAGAAGQAIVEIELNRPNERRGDQPVRHDARCLHAELAAIRCAAAEFSRPSINALSPFAACRGGGGVAGLASLRRRSR